MTPSLHQAPVRSRHSLSSLAVTWLTDVLSDPSFAWSIGGVSIEYSPPARVCFSLAAQWEGGTHSSVTGLKPGARYAYNSTGDRGAVQADGSGRVEVLLRSVTGACLVLAGGGTEAE